MMKDEMIDFFEKKFKPFIEAVKRHICSTVKMGRYEDFFKNLKIQLLAEPLKKLQQDSNDQDALMIYGSTSCWVTEEKVSREEHVLNDSDMWIKKEEITGSSNISGSFSYKLTWFVEGAKNFDFVKRYIVEVLLYILNENVKSFDLFEEKSVKTIFSDVEFMDKYYSKIKDTFKLPDRTLLSQIAFRTYENRENNGIICFLRKEDGRRLVKPVVFSDKSVDEMGLNEKNTDNMRKLLEISKPGYEGDESKCLLFDPESMQCWGLTLEEKAKKLSDCLFVYFLGSGSWQIKYNGDVVIQSNYNTLCFDEDVHESLWRDKLPKQITAPQIFCDLIRCLEKQKHGALIIIASEVEAEIETDRLCDQFKRGTKLKNPLPVNNKDALSQVSGFCSVDGAIFMDLGGNCYGYGIILDGEAKVEGDRGRGARYNSANNYIANKNRYAIVVSEDKDKGIRILPESKPVG